VELSELTDDELDAELVEAMAVRDAARDRVLELGREKARREPEPDLPDGSAQVVRPGAR